METECVVCSEAYQAEGDKRPKLLPCSHTYCLGCLRRLINYSVLSCPECRTTHRVPQGGAEAFPTNRYILGYLEELGQARGTTTEQRTSLRPEVILRPDGSILIEIGRLHATGSARTGSAGTGSTRIQPSAPPEVEEQREEERGGCCCCSCARLGRCCCEFWTPIGLVLLHVVGIILGLPLSILCVFVVVGTTLIFLVFVTGRMMWFYIIRCLSFFKEDHSCCGAGDNYSTTVKELKETLEYFFKECRRGVLCCYATCFGCEAVTKVFYHIAVWFVLVIVVAISYPVATVIFVSICAALAAVGFAVYCLVKTCELMC